MNNISKSIFSKPHQQRGRTMSNLIEELVLQNNRCFDCGALVYAVEKKKTTNHVYHNRCFRCRICKRNLTGLTLNEEGDDIYCENCYRKKQRGDCETFEFRRAAAERAEYVHISHHPDLPSPLPNTAPPLNRERSRHPSWTLRRIERKMLGDRHVSLGIDSNNDETNDELYKKSLSANPNINFQRFKFDNSLSAPVNTTNHRPANSTSNDESSPPPTFSPVFSPVFPPTPFVRTETTIKPRGRTPPADNKPNKNVTPATGTIEFRLNKSSTDLRGFISPPTERRSVLIPDLNKDEESNKSKESTFHFPIPDKTKPRSFHRSSSRNRNRDANRLRIE